MYFIKLHHIFIIYLSFLLLFKKKLNKSGADVEATKNKIRDLEMSSERLKEEIAYLEDDIKQAISNKEKVFYAYVDFYINLHLNNSKKKT